MPDDRLITVMGATGYTGRLIAHALLARAARFAIAGRSEAKLRDLSRVLGDVEYRLADIADRASLQRMAERSRVVINCAGPFVDLGEPVVLAAIEAGAHYLDTTGEQPFIKAMRAHDAAAKEHGVAVVPAMAFEVALSDCAAAVAADGFVDLHSVHVTYAIAMRASQGTQRTALRMLGSTGYAYLGGQWCEEPPARVRTTVDFPPPIGRVTAVSFPSAEVVTIPWHQRVREVRVFMQVPPLAARVVSAVSPMLPLIGRAAALVATRWIGDGTDGPDEAARRGTAFHIAVDVRGVRRGRVAQRRVLLTGADPYGLTAAIAVKAAEWMSRPQFDRRGVLPPAGAVEPRAFLDAMREDGVSYEVSDMALA